MLARVPAAEGEDGFTLVEVLVTLVILSFATVTLLGVMTSLSVVTQHHRGLATTDVAVRGWGEAVKGKAIAATSYTVCPEWNPDLDPGYTLPTGTVAASTPTVEYWMPNSTSDPFNGSFTSDRTDCTNRFKDVCRDTSVVQDDCDPGVQRITLSVKSTDPTTQGGQTTTVILVRRGNTT